MKLCAFRIFILKFPVFIRIAWERGRAYIYYVKPTRFLILAFVTVCYLQAALEINTEGIENSWGDAYDMYVFSGSITHQTTFKKETAADFISDKSANAFTQTIIHTPFTNVPFNPHQEDSRIFLKFRSIRI